MRLIDADKLRHELIMGHDLVGAKYTDMADTVKAIPLDKPFCKMVYGDYVVYNKKWLVNHLQTEWNILQGKEYKPAIPVEWIKEHYAYYGLIKQLIEEWEKENDVNR